MFSFIGIGNTKTRLALIREASKLAPSTVSVTLGSVKLREKRIEMN
jgi:hypothetical protein